MKLFLTVLSLKVREHLTALCYLFYLESRLLQYNQSYLSKRLLSNMKPVGLVASFVTIFITCTLIGSTEARPKTRNPHEIRPGRFNDVDRFDEIYDIFKYTFLLACAPLVISFLFSLYRDPATPILAKAAIRALKRRLLGNLSSNGGSSARGKPKDSRDRIERRTDLM